MTMKVASEADVKERFGDFLDETQNGPIVVTRNSEPIALLIAIHAEEDLEGFALASSKLVQEVFASGQQQIREGRLIPHDEFWKQAAKRYSVEKEQ